MDLMIHFHSLNKVQGLGATKEQQKARAVTQLSDIHTAASSKREATVGSTFKPSDLPQLSKQHRTGFSTIHLVYRVRVSSVFKHFHKRFQNPPVISSQHLSSTPAP